MADDKLVQVIGCSARSVNLKRSIIAPVNISVIEEYLKKPEVELLRACYPDGNFFMWAFQTRNKKSFRQVTPGALIFLKEKGTGLFNYRGEIAAAFEGDSRIGKAVWDDEKWTELLFIKNIVDNTGIPMEEISLLLSKKNPPDPGNYFEGPSVKTVERSKVEKLIERFAFKDVQS